MTTPAQHMRVWSRACDRLADEAKRASGAQMNALYSAAALCAAVASEYEALAQELEKEA